MAEKNDARGFIGLRDLTDAGALANKRQEAEGMRSFLKREWALNRAFYAGDQYSFWNREMLRVESMPQVSGNPWRVRLQSNQIKPGLMSMAAQMTKNRPAIFAEPNAGGDTDVKAAQMATSLFDYLYDTLNLNSKTQAALVEAGLSGGYWKVTWDALAGTPMTFTMGPDGNPILDDELAEAFIDTLTDKAAPAGYGREDIEAMAKKTVYLGDVKVEVMSAENVLLDPGASSFEEANWAICKHAMDPDEIKARWGKTVSPNAINATDTPLFGGQRTQEQKPVATVREVFIMYIRPNPSLPDGRYVAWIEGPDTILQDMPWPYKHRILPLVKFPGLYRPNSPYDDPVVTDVRPLQKQLNKTISQIVEHQNLVMRPQLLAAFGSLRTKMTDEPGAVIEYNAVGPNPPEWRNIPALPQTIYENLADIQNRIDKAFNRLPTSRDQIPARADGGTLLESMLEATADQLSQMILGIEDGLARAGELMISYAQQYYEEPRLLKIRGANGGIQVKKFEAAQLEGGFTFRPKYGTGLPRSRQGRQDAILQLLDSKLIDPQTAMKHLDLGDLRGVQAQMAADEDMALREHDKMLRGIPINPAALQQAQEAITQFQQQASEIVHAVAAGKPIDLDGDGQPDPPQMVIQQLQQQMESLQKDLQDAPWKPLDYENSQAHVGTHSDLMKTLEFEGYPPEIQAIFLQHYNLTYQRMIDMMLASPDPNATPKVNVRAMATVSAPVMAKILQKAGINTDANDVAQPALDTAVIDDLNQPKVNAGGDDPLTQLDQALTMQQQQDAHLVAQADAAAGMADAQATAQQAQEKHDLAQQGEALRQQQAAEMHQANLKAKAAQAKQAARPPAKKNGR